MRADLHIHSTASDGRLSPAQLKAQGLELGLDYMALTDHDTLQGLAAWPGEDPGPMLIPGVEISCALDTEIHLLAYGVSAQMTPLADFLAQMRRERAERAARMAQALRALGFRVSLERLTSPPAESVGRAHLARILFESGQVASIQEAFARYLAPGRPAYVPLPKQSPSQVLRLLQACGAVPVLAHPGQYGFSPAGLESLLKQWQREGLMGLEVYHSANRPVPPYLRLARSLGLMVTGGSDFHGGDGYHSPLGSQTKAWRSVSQDMERLLSALGK